MDSPEILMHQLISLLKSPSIDESSLIDLVGMDMIYNIPELLDRKVTILSEWNSALTSTVSHASPPTTHMGDTLSQIRLKRESDIIRSKQVRKMEKKKMIGVPKISGFDDEIDLLSKLGWDGSEPAPSSIPHRGTLGVGGPKLTLPEGTTRHTFENFEEFRIPAQTVDGDNQAAIPLVSVDSLPSWCRPVFSSDSAFLNKIQSKIFPIAFHTNENFLACAPTGAGKTNVSLLAICRLIKEWKETPNPSIAPKFKVVYLAPMKALVAEIVEKFTKKLGNLGISVREFTGDISIPRKELEFTNIIVTVPEKWDILMRNLGKVSAAIIPGEEDSSASLLAQIKLMIIDEVHLLNDERGAVIESIVARTMQFCESNFSPIRFVALSATFPNYEDIGQFLGVAKSNMFYFDNSYRPVPLEQTIVGVGRPAPPSTSDVPVAVSKNVNEAINKVTADKVLNILREGQQVMVFVHSRNDTVKTAESLIDIISTKLGAGETGLLTPKISTPQQSSLLQTVSKGHSNKVRNIMNNLIQSGITIHHAGMLRPERTLAENLFKEGIASVLVCTATLAWGVNLPSRYVIIKGTNIWDSSSGGFRDIDLLDILQIFGRAGRPQFDTIGRATLITSRDRLDYFLRLITSQIPIESRFSTHLPDALNAEIALGNISSLEEAVNWLKYTYMFVRFFKAPQKYEIGISDIPRDPQLVEFRTALIKSAAETLNTARLIRVNRQSSFASTDLGRVAAHFYVRYDTAEMFATRLRPDMTDSEIIELIGNANEFSQLKCREDEMQELESVALDKTICPIAKIRGGGVSSIPGKVSVLLQVYVSRNYYFQSSSLSSDMNYVAQNIVRLFRCLFEVSLTRTVGVSGLSQRLLEWSKIVERRIWHSDVHHFLRHYTMAPTWFYSSSGGPGGPKLLKEWIVQVLEDRRFDLYRIFDHGLSRSEIANLVKGSPDAGKSLELFLRRIPRIEIQTRAVPIAAEILQVELTLSLVNEEWSDSWSGLTEPFHVFIADTEQEDIYSHTHLVVHKSERNEKIEIKTIIPLTDPRPNQLSVSVVSDRYVGLDFFETITLPKTLTAAGAAASVSHTTTLLDLYPLPKSALKNPEFEKIFSFSHFNPIQTQLFHQVFHTDENILCGCPTGSGKTVIADLAILRILALDLRQKTIYIAPQKALSRERIIDWQARFGRILGRSVVELTGDFTPDIDALNQADIIITTPEKWDGISRNWRNRNYVGKVGLVILDEIHLLGQERGAILEVIVSRMRMVSESVRFIGLSTALANSIEIANWLNVHPIRGLFNFKPSVRPVPMTVHVQGFPGKHYCPRMATMNKPCLQAIKDYSPEKPVIVFVSSRRQTRLTAFDIITYASQENFLSNSPWLKLDPVSDPPIETIIDQIENEALKHSIAFGVGIHHAGLRQADREIVEKLFQNQKIQILVATSTLSVGINMPAHLVIVKGTEYFDPKKKKYVDMPVTDVLQMMGRAGRPQYDSTATSVVMVHEPKKNFYRKFLYSPFPLESSLHLQLTDHLNAEIANGSIRDLPDALDFIAWTYFFRRLTVNPDYYISESSADTVEDVDRIGSYVKSLVMKSVTDLEKSFCVKLDTGMVSLGEKVRFTPTRVGQIASMYYLRHSTVSHLYKKLVTTCSSVGLSMMELAKILADSDEYEEFPMRHKDDEYNTRLASDLPMKVTGNMESPHMKALLVQLMHMFHVEPPIQDYFTDLKSFLDQSVRIIQGMIEIIMISPKRESALRTVMNLLLLNQCLAVGTHPWADLVEAMVSKQHAKIVKGNEIEDVCDLVEYVNRRNDSSKPLPKPVMNLAKAMPCVNFGCQFEPNNDWLKIQIEHVNRPDENAVIPLSMLDSKASGGKRRKVAWWIVVGDELCGSVISVRRISLSDRPRTITVKLDQYRTPSLTVYLVSDCYLGLDQEHSLEVI